MLGTYPNQLHCASGTQRPGPGVHALNPGLKDRTFEFKVHWQLMQLLLRFVLTQSRQGHHSHWSLQLSLKIVTRAARSSEFAAVVSLM